MLREEETLRRRTLFIAVARSSDVLDPNGMSEDVAGRRGRKTWPEGVVGRRGRKAWSEDVAGRRGRKAWPKGVVGRRACGNRRTSSNGSALMVKCFGQIGVVDRVRELWKQLTLRGLQPGPLAFSCMTVALVTYEHPDEALVLIHIHANSEKARACINTVTYNTVLKDFTMGKRAKEVFSTFEVLK